MLAQRLSGKVALVTGASRGLGFETSLHLAREGAHVVATARTKAGLEELDDAIKSVGGSATLVPLDIRDFDGIDRLGAAIYERWQKLDILIGNAGVLGKLTPLPHLDPKIWAEALDVNVTANFRLIRSIDPLLRSSEKASAIFVTSGLAQKAWAFWGAYSATKAALEAIIKSYAAEMEASTVRVNCFSPGATRTKMRAKAMPGEDASTLPSATEVSAQIIDMCLPEFDGHGGIYKYAPTGLFRQT